MCLLYVLSDRRHTRHHTTNKTKGPPKYGKEKKKTLKPKRKVKQQLTLEECFGINPSSLADESNGVSEVTGDPLIDKEDTWVRFAFQNTNEISLCEGLEVMPENAVIGALQIDVTALTETNIHWNQSNRDKSNTSSTITLGTQE